MVHNWRIVFEILLARDYIDVPGNESFELHAGQEGREGSEKVGEHLVDVEPLAERVEDSGGEQGAG